MDTAEQDASGVGLKRILFVDDDTNVLASIRRSVHKFKHFKLSYANKPSEALELVKRSCFDVVISDMRMPEMDGATLLREVKRICPTTVRFVLSGQADQKIVVKAIDCVHQYFSKPCVPSEVTKRIEKIAALPDSVSDQKYQKLCNSIAAVPAASARFLEWTEEISGSMPSLERLIEIASQDVGLAAKLLQLVNSSFFGAFGDVVHPREAVRLLGVDTLTEIYVKSGAVITGIDRTSAISVTEVNDKAVSLAKEAAKRLGDAGGSKEDSDYVYSAALLRGIGPLIAGCYAPQLLNLEEESTSELNTLDSFIEISEKTLGVTNYLLTLWGIPVSVPSYKSKALISMLDLGGIE